MHPSPLALAILSIVATPACTMFTHVDAGYVASDTDRPGRQGAAIQLRAGAGDGPVAVEVGLRTRFAESVQRVSLSTDVAFVAPFDFPILPFATLGLEALSFEGVDGSFAFGMFSPFVEGGLAVPFDRGDAMFGLDAGGFVGVLAFTEYAVRFTSQPNEVAWGLLVAVGFGASVSAP